MNADEYIARLTVIERAVQGLLQDIIALKFDVSETLDKQHNSDVG